MHDHVILIVYHKNDDLTKFHIEQFQKFNSDVPIFPIRHEDFDLPEYWLYNWMWGFCDNIFYRWFLSNEKVLSDRYFIFDYDTFCNESVKNFYSQCWDARFVSSVNFSFKDNPNWYWFNFYKSKFDGAKDRVYKDNRHGALPMSGMMISHDDAKLLIDFQMQDPFWKDCISELRIGSILKMNNVPMTSLPRPRLISPFTRHVPINYHSLKGIFHPVKSIYDISKLSS